MALGILRECQQAFNLQSCGKKLDVESEISFVSLGLT